MEFNDKEAIYLQIASLVCEHILSGKWPAGERALSVRDLAVELQVNPNTVMRSYEFLQSIGVLFNKRGYGLYVSQDGKEKVTEFNKQRFFHEDLPRIFKSMSLLGVSGDEFLSEYHQYLKNGEQKRESDEKKEK